MSSRGIVGIVFAIALIVEVALFMAQPEINKQVRNGQPRAGFFSGYDIVRDYEAEKDRNTKFITLIVVTAVAGGIVTFSIPNKQISRNSKGIRWSLAIGVFLLIWIFGSATLSTLLSFDPERERFAGITSFLVGILVSLSILFRGNSEERNDESPANPPSDGEIKR